MASGKKVVLRKPRLNMDKQVDLTPTPPTPLTSKMARESPDKPNPKPIQNNQKVKQDPKPTEEIQKESTTPSQDNSDDELELSEDLLEDPPKILKTASNRTIKATKIPEPIVDAQPVQTFDEKFIDNLDIKSKITKDTKMLEKIQKPDTKPASKSKLKGKRQFNFFAVLSFIAVIFTSYLAYVTLQEYTTSITTASLAYFIYVVATVVLAFMMLAWFIVELIVKDRK
jgi:hypothetical protein